MKMKSQQLQRDGSHRSPWQHEFVEPLIDKIYDHETIFDCLIVGGGITGLTAALTLQRNGMKTVLAEAHVAGFGTTGGTSAHINTFADTTYTEAEKAFGEDGALLFSKAVNRGLAIIHENADRYKISCDLETKAGYVYAEDEDQEKDLQELYDGTVKVGVPIRYVEEVPIPIKYRKAVVLDGQAQFNPLKYLQGLINAYSDAGGILLENTPVGDVTSEEFHTVSVPSGNIRAKAIIYATHTPPGITPFNFLNAAYRSYVLAVKLRNGNYPDCLIYDMQDPYHYFRTHEIDGEPLLIAGGNDHKTGHDDPEKAFADLEKYVRKYFNVSSVKYRWSSQYYIPVDGLPYVGQIPLKPAGIYCATGYNGNGMMLGSVSGELLADLVAGKENPYAGLFSTTRIKPVAGFTEFVKENADVVYHFIADRLGVHETDSLKRLQPGTGKLVELDGKKVAAYRDDDGTIHALNPVCTHAKCIVNWNQEEKSWDCPCHGARYDVNGEVLTGPATKRLERLDY